MKPKAALSAKEAAGLLRLSMVKILRWAHEGKIPCRIDHEEPYFLRSEIRGWAAERGLALDESPLRTEGASSVPEHRDKIIVRAVRAGGVRFGLKGQDVVRVLENAVRELPFSPERKGPILEALLDREEAASTGLGRGVAVPHPRKPLEGELHDPLLPIFFLENPVEFNAVDGRPVDVLFMIFSPSTSVHLELLGKLSFLLKKEGFLAKLRSLKTEEEVLSLIESAEQR